MVEDFGKLIFFPPKKHLKEALFIFTACVSISSLIVLVAHDPIKFINTIKIPISDKAPIPLFLVMGVLMLTIIGSHYIVKRYKENKDGKWYDYSQQELELFSQNTKNPDILYEIEEEDTSCETDLENINKGDSGFAF